MLRSYQPRQAPVQLRPRQARREASSVAGPRKRQGTAALEKARTEFALCGRQASMVTSATGLFQRARRADLSPRSLPCVQFRTQPSLSNFASQALHHLLSPPTSLRPQQPNRQQPAPPRLT